MGHKNVMSLVKLWENFEEILYQNSNSLEEIIGPREAEGPILHFSGAYSQKMVS